MTTSTVFTNILPEELRLPDHVKHVDANTRDNKRNITTLDQSWDSFFLNGPAAYEDFMSERATQEQSDHEAL